MSLLFIDLQQFIKTFILLICLELYLQKKYFSVRFKAVFCGHNPAPAL